MPSPLIERDGRRDAERASAGAFHERQQLRRAFFGAFMKPWVTMTIHEKAASAMRNQHLRKATNSWIENAADRRRARETMLAAATSMCHAGMKKALNEWIGKAEEAAEAKRKLLSAAASLRSIGARKAMNAWRAAAAAAAEAQRQLHAAASSLRNVAARKA